ncbi:hypothetical protein PsYK624_021070 [Phanerochaete sordida]|uniref:Uncharacterized protein n=1 Tax=Phanerochaete sordida TaxID=48140 RepID=A0A9P3G0T7_9APHY|nr:hypothetical protein PsYK624_021070 [Phanerochaete sordida]
MPQPTSPCNPSLSPSLPSPSPPVPHDPPAMSPSLRNLTAEYVKTRLQSVKLPLSASGRFNVDAVRARLPARLRKAKPAGLLEHEETSPADDPEYCVVEANGGAQERDKADALQRHENSLEEMTLVAFLQEHKASKGATAGAAPTPPAVVGGPDVCDASLANDSSFSSVSETNSTGACTPLDAQNSAHVDTASVLEPAPLPATEPAGPPGLSDTPSDDLLKPAPSLAAPRSPEFSHSPLGSDILDALETFDAEGHELVRFDAGYMLPLRSLQTIYEEDSTMLDTRESLRSSHPAEEVAVALSAERDSTEDFELVAVPASLDADSSPAPPTAHCISSVPWYSQSLYQLARLASRSPSTSLYARTLPPYSPSLNICAFEYSATHFAGDALHFEDELD